MGKCIKSFVAKWIEHSNTERQIRGSSSGKVSANWFQKLNWFGKNKLEVEIKLQHTQEAKENSFWLIRQGDNKKTASTGDYQHSYSITANY